MPTYQQPEGEKTFVQKVWITGFIFAIIISLILFFTASVHVFILILVGALIACYFRGLGRFISIKTKVPLKISIIISVVATLLFTSGLFFLAGSTAANQFSELQEKFPEILKKSEDFLNNTLVGEKFSEFIENNKNSENSGTMISSFFKSTFGGIGDIFVIIVIGIYFTTSPNIYRDGIILLVPPRGRERAKEVIDKIATGLTKWLLGKFFAMSLIFVLTAIALAIIGLPFWLALALIAGLLVFIPNFGPIVSAIPALLVALSVSGEMALMVGIIYLVIQLSEGSIITPKVQERLVNIPPAAIILGQIFAFMLIGVWGLVFATPIVYIIMTLVKELYIKPMEEKAELKEFEYTQNMDDESSNVK